ncbi:MAG: hypothetical protein HUU20_03625 [Pirellulales bacterium]|nr:hypothetical protein [Pirellulales bacterium]
MQRFLVVVSLLIAMGKTDFLSRVRADGGNLIDNPGFEEPLPSKLDNPYAAWAFANHDQDFIRSQIDAQDFHSGRKAAAISVAGPPRVYASWYRHVRLQSDDQIPDQVSLWYRSPESDAAIVLGFTGSEDGKSVAKGGATVTLPKSNDWRQVTESLQVPFGTRDIQVELRVWRQGEYRFDDVALCRTEPSLATRTPDRILFVGAEKLTYLWETALKAGDWGRLALETWDNLSPELLQRCRAVVLVSLPLRPDLTPRDEATIQLLSDYVEAGGGLMLNQQAGQVITSQTIPFALARCFGTQILLEKTVSDPAATRQVGAWGSDHYTYTDKISGPAAEGIKGVLYQSHVDLMSLGGVLPFLPRAPWQVIVSAGPASKTETFQLGLEEIDRHSRSEGFASEVPLAGVREFGKGRVAYFGMLPDIVFTRAISSDEDRQTHEAYLTRGVDGFPSDLQRLYLNTFTWLAAHADQLESAQLKRGTARTVPYTTAWKSFRGVVGPRTCNSSGESTPEEYVAKAKAAGLDFLVFLEDFAALKAGGFESLKADCARLSDGAFLALPGITYENADGNHEFAFGRHLKLPSAKLLAQGGKRFLAMTDPGATLDLVWLYTLCGFENHSGWYRFAENPYPHFDARNVSAMGVITQEGGRTVESVLDAYAREARNGQFLWPLALTLMKSAEEMALVEQGVYYHNEVGIEGTAKLDPFLNTLDGRSARNLFPGAPCFGQVFMSNGPTINLRMPRGDTDPDGDLWNPCLQEWPLDLAVASPAGLKEVRVMDGTTLLRRYLPGGVKEFQASTSLGRERQRAIYVRAVDKAGREAVSRDITSDSWILRDTQCADRNNQLLYSMQKRADGTPFYISYGGDTPMPDKGPWNGRTRPVGCFVFDARLGVGAMSYDGSPEQHPQTFFSPSCWYEDKPPEPLGWQSQLVAGKEGAAHVEPHRVVHSSDVLIGERILDGVFPVQARPVIHVWHTLYPVKPSAFFKTTARQYLYLVKVDGVSVYLWDQEFEVLKDILARPKSGYALGIGRIMGSTATRRVIVSGGRVVDQGELKGKPVQTIPFNRGDYIGLLHSPFGSLAVYSLSDGLLLAGDGVNYGVGFKPDGDVLRAGAKLRARMLLVGMHRMVDDPAALAEKIVGEYGLTGRPSYAFAVAQGEAGGADYPAPLRAGEDGCFVGELTGVVDMAGNLGVAVSGLNDRWTAFCQSVGEDPATDAKTRLIAVEGGTGYAVLRAEDEGRRVFLGHPLIADRPEVVLSVTRSRDWKQWVAEIHNPTDATLRVAVCTNPHIMGLRFEETITLGAGTSVSRRLDSALTRPANLEPGPPHERTRSP